jgi:hypothetical protein
VVHIGVDGVTVKAKIIDISESGLAAAVNHDITPGTCVHMRLLLPGAKRFVEATGKVVRVTDDRIGFRFAEFRSEQHQAHFHSWLSHFQNFGTAREESTAAPRLKIAAVRREDRTLWKKLLFPR